MRIGYFLSSEEFDPHELIRQARMAEDAGFQGLWISDHYHPWNGEQGHSWFVWSTIGALAEATSTMNVTTAVTRPTVHRQSPQLTSVSEAVRRLLRHTQPITEPRISRAGVRGEVHRVRSTLQATTNEQQPTGGK
jgi:hypothetical protein